MRTILEAPLARALPWRCRRWTELVALRSMRFRPEAGEVPVSPGNPTASLIAVGDISLHFYDDEELAVPSPAEPRQLLAAMRPVLRTADLRVANLESVLTRVTRPAREEGKFLRGDPALAEVLVAAGFDAVTCANNHCLDFGPDGLADSIDNLRRHGIRAAGVGGSAAAAREPVVMSARGLSVGMLGYGDDFNVFPRWEGGVRPAFTNDDEIVEDVARLRERVDLVVLQLHWGYEWSMYPLLTQRDRARRFAEAGADVVLCHHAHVPMAVEAWNGSVIAHGLGNLMWGWNAAPMHPWRNRSYLLKVSFNESGVTTAEIIPCGVRPDHAIVPLAQGPRREVLGAHWALRRGLADSARLTRLESDRVVRESQTLVERFAGIVRSGDADAAQERALHLRAPRQRALIGMLRDGDRFPGGPEIAAALEHVAAEGDSAPGALGAARAAITGSVTARVRELASSPRLLGEPLGRVP
jgi:poly-gamma-glutamate synthesis protein (capsule biosynthesis protein)